MAELRFSQAERRNYLVPVLLVMVLAGIVAALIYRYTPHHIASVTVLRTAAVPTQTVFKAGASDSAAFKILGTQAENDLYIVATVQVKDELKLPIFIKDLTATVTTADGAEMHSSAVEKNDIQALVQNFPKLKPLTTALLLRETEIPPGGSVEGAVVFHFGVQQSVWDQRTSATITVDPYHQGQLEAEVPKP